MKLDYIVDQDGQEFVFENEWDTVIPVSFEQVGDTLTVSYFPAVEKEIQSHFAKFGKNPAD